MRVHVCLVGVFFKQKTAYEMRISDWSSDVCSSDLPSVPLQPNDTLWVFSRADIAFMNTAAVRQIVLGQPNPLPECKSLSRFADTVRDTQSSRFSVLTRGRSEEHTSELQSLMRISYAVFCLKKKKRI